MIIAIGVILFILSFFVLSLTLNKSRVSFNNFYDFDWHVVGSTWAIFVYLGILAALGVFFVFVAKFGLKFYPA